tara:strand:+ start:253 stop:1266 length:1014 start_codon:yes stop_codon:yes gene_type:complete
MGEPLKVDHVRAGFGKVADGLGKAAENVGRLARSTSAQVVEQAGDLKGAAEDSIEKLTTKKPDPYEEAIAEYNGAFTAMNDSGLSLLRQRERSTDLIDLVEFLVNSIANTPKSFGKDFEEIDVHKAQFVEVLEFARKDLEAARASAAGAGAGFAAGAAVASMAPTAAMWAATTFGVASTGTAISTLSGAAATNAALAWLGGGALAAGGGGTAAGSALLALAGPIGWTVAGATLLVSIVLFTRKRLENRDAKQEALAGVKYNIAFVRGVDAQIDDLLQRTAALREHLLNRYRDALVFFGADFLALSASEQSRLAALVNNAKAAAALLSHTVNQETADA